MIAPPSVQPFVAVIRGFDGRLRRSRSRGPEPRAPARGLHARSPRPSASRSRGSPLPPCEAYACLRCRRCPLTPESSGSGSSCLHRSLRPGRMSTRYEQGDLLVLAGHIPIGADQFVLGKLGDDLDVDAGRAAARLAALSALATMRAELGSLDRVERIVSLRGVVNATPDFTEHTQVIDGASDVFVQVFAERGQHARLAVASARFRRILRWRSSCSFEVGEQEPLAPRRVGAIPPILPIQGGSRLPSSSPR